jgi:hypothetical protein
LPLGEKLVAVLNHLHRARVAPSVAYTSTCTNTRNNSTCTNTCTHIHT